MNETSFITTARPNSDIAKSLRDSQESTCYKYYKNLLTKCSEDDPDCLIKTTIYEEGERKYTKLFIKASSKGNLYNPWGLESEGTIRRFEDERGQPLWTFKQVLPEVYQRYIKFLETQNEVHLTIAERTFKDNSI